MALEKFQNLLRELFEFDHADLDFGIYRVMNHKRQVIERFIAEDLPKAIDEELQRAALAKQQKAYQDLEEARREVIEHLGEGALDAEGNLKESLSETRVGKAYQDAQKKAKGAHSTESLRTAIYNHLYTFFSRYWQEGDFFSLRRYSKRERYAIPYNGEEVYLYWANKDQYYIKTGEYFTDYTYKAPNGVTVHFKLLQADVEQNGVKGEKRFFLPVLGDISWDEATRTLTIPFHYRPFTKGEVATYGDKNQQENIISKAVKDIPEAVAEKLTGERAQEVLPALRATRPKRQDSSSVSYLEHHLRQYTRRNTRDFFIHKDLKGFLSRELDFYLKNEVLNLDELEDKEDKGEELSEGWFQLMRLIKRIGNQIIDFLAQIEDFQKMLWEKKKFVTETFYVITVGNIPEAFYEEIAANDAQWEEWKQMLHIDEEQTNLFTAGKEKKDKRVEFLKTHPTLPLDTRHFPSDFTDRLLASFDNLDDLTDGLLIHSENWQALNFLQEKYRERVKCIYIDPPYNTGNDDFLYRDAYRHSSWLTMMENRLVQSSRLITHTGVIFVSNNENEYSRLRMLLDEVFGRQQFIENLIWRKKSGGGQTDEYFVTEHDYITCYAKQKGSFKLYERTRVRSSKDYPHYDEKKSRRYKRIKLAKWGAGAHREDRPTMYFPLSAPDGQEVYPVAPDGRPGRWRYSKAALLKKQKDDLVDWVWKDDKWIPYEKVYEPQEGEDEHALLKERSILYDLVENASGSNELKGFFGVKDVFLNPKPSKLIYHLLSLSTTKGDIILDYFAGSGTTGHAVINLNREVVNNRKDGGQRKFILVEVAHHFDTVLLPRIKKVIFTPEWKDGKPKRLATPEEVARSPRIVKVIRLESY
ncbi:MAG: site-specific DNA-methyltransferase, partial [Thermus sp.]|uniref:site-specific DNA-methyltransferase n=1 Tax=Thermus sp. TaxID=275 RepID=UPI00391932D9